VSGKFKAVLLLGVVYALGVGSGIAWQTYRFHHFTSPRAMFIERRIKRLKAQLNLSDAQEQAIREIFQKAHERASQVNEEVSWDLADIHKDSVKAIEQLLTPEQMRKFEKMHKRYHAKNKHMPADDFEESTGTARAAGS
jgi:Spy/CpxP family protein refolding chaperone